MEHPEWSFEKQKAAMKILAKKIAAIEKKYEETEIANEASDEEAHEIESYITLARASLKDAKKMIKNFNLCASMPRFGEKFYSEYEESIDQSIEDGLKICKTTRRCMNAVGRHSLCHELDALAEDD